jgi:hypothetical protein
MASECVPHQGDHKGPLPSSASSPTPTMITGHLRERLGVVVRAGAAKECGAACPAITNMCRGESLGKRGDWPDDPGACPTSPQGGASTPSPHIPTPAPTGVGI